MGSPYCSHHAPRDERSMERTLRKSAAITCRPLITRSVMATFVVSVLLTSSSTRRATAEGTLRFRVNDGEGHPIPARVHLRDEAGKAVTALGHKDHLDHLTLDGERTLSLPVGTYVYGVERSPEWERVSGEVTIDEGGSQTVDVVLQQLVDLKQHGWYSGDLHIHRPADEVEDLMRASDLHIGPVITWWNDHNHWQQHSLPKQPLVRFDGNRFAHLVAGEDEREGGALLYFGLDEPLDITGSGREFPSPMTFVQQARRQSDRLHLDIEKPFWWDVPVWLALAKPDTIGLANNHMCRDRMYETEAWGKPRDAKRLPPPLGNGYWTQELYYHILNAGLRIPPSAGSASGVLPNPVGYNRVYVHVDGELTWDKWWNGLRAGRSFVTNGPILDCQANGELPGTVFQGTSDRPFRVSLDVKLTSTDPVTKIEIVHNGEIVKSLLCEETRTQQLVGEFTIRESGWFLVRAITDNPRTFRFASTAPYYVELGEPLPRISRASCQFFVDWVNERIERVQNNLTDPDERAAVLRSHQEAKQYWQLRVEMATTP